MHLCRTSQLGLDYMTMHHPDNVRTAQMTDNCNKEIDHRHQPTNTQNVIMHHKTITEVITGIHRLRGTTIQPVLDVMKISNISGEDITKHHRHNGDKTEINNSPRQRQSTLGERTRPYSPCGGADFRLLDRELGCCV